jgi:crotonobetaine/carnitine-CoA ligase
MELQRNVQVTPLRFGFAGAGISNPAADTLPLTERVPAKILALQAKAAPESPFVHVGGGWVSYGEADVRASRAANALAGIGAKKGMRVALIMRNRLEFLDLWFGLSRIGAIQVPLNPEYRMPQFEHVFKRAPVDFVIAESEFLDELRPALRSGTMRPRLLTLGPDASGEGQDYLALFASASSHMPESAAAVCGSDVAAVMNTSGTTGPSKGVLLPHAAQYVLGRNISADMSLGPDDVFYNFFPLFHNTSQAMIVVAVLLHGARMVLVEKFSASRFWYESREHGCTAFYYIGEIIHILLKSTSREEAIGSKIRVGWGIGAAASDMWEFRQRFGIVLRGGYGSTEANVPCYLPHDTVRASGAGQPIPGFQVRIGDEYCRPVPTGEQGEILVRPEEPYSMMLGYDGDAAATVSAWQQLWFHTGDAASMDEDGHIVFKGRVKDAIRVRGENISAFDVEQAIGKLFGVAEVAAIAVPSDIGGDDLKIVVVLEPGIDIRAEDLIEHAQSCLPRYSIPRYIEFVDALPKTSTNKTQKHVLRATPFTATTWDRMSSNTK